MTRLRRLRWGIRREYVLESPLPPVKTQPRAPASVPLPKPRPTDLPGPAATPSGWNASGVTTTFPANNDNGSFQPLNPGATTDAVLASVKALAPMGVTGVDPLQALDGVKDGTATITIPLQPGHYKAAGHGFDVKPGTVVHVQVEVKDGRIVPARDADGRPTGRGTQIEVDPPLNLLLWVKGKGAYVQDAGGAQEAFKADVGGWFRSGSSPPFNSSRKLSDVVRQFSSTPASDDAARQARRRRRRRPPAAPYPTV